MTSLFRGLIILSVSLVLIILSSSWATDFNDEFPYQSTTSNAQTESIKDMIEVGVIDEKGPIQQLIKLFLPNNPTGSETLTLTSYIQYIVNLALSIVAFVATIVLIVGFYGILFGKSQEGIENAQKTVKGAVIALLIMGASWIIVRLLFYVITLLR